ncbi:hypothetical protein BJ165DRAFT_433755 [Panaeolus papilionaceus]|nr:hypothetical protein BJ165DRAFT_433755 [Panaeolus papilionaceus]
MMTSNVVEELQLIQCSLLPGESFTFMDDSEAWDRVLEDLTTSGSYADKDIPSAPPHFQVRVDDGGVWFDVTMLVSAAVSLEGGVLVKGDNLSRDEQVQWQGIVRERVEEVVDSGAQYPMYELLSSHLLPLLHEDAETKAASIPLATDAPSDIHEREIYHALFSSHHLISPNKRRSLQSWSHSLSIQGFAKVGYPGVIYAQGEKESVEEFVGNVKAMQWLALRLRFMEPLPVKYSDDQERMKSGYHALEGWREMEKVGEVVEAMRRIGREEYVVEMGIGSAGAT